MATVTTSTTQGQVVPIQPADRIDLLDSLRGFALLGIFGINLVGFSGWRYIGAEDQAALVSSGIDGSAIFLFTLLIEGKFYSLFSMLFGIGFAIMMLRAEEKGADFAPRFRRRLWVLAGSALASASIAITCAYARKGSRNRCPRIAADHQKAHRLKNDPEHAELPTANFCRAAIQSGCEISGRRCTIQQWRSH